MANFLDQKDGGFVAYTKGKSEIADLVGDRIYPDAPRQGVSSPYIVYMQTMGNRIKTHSGISSQGLRNAVIHVLCVAESQSAANDLALLVEERWLAVDHTTTAGVLVQVCNGGIDESGKWFAADGSDTKLFYSRVVLRMVLGQ